MNGKPPKKRKLSIDDTSFDNRSAAASVDDDASSVAEALSDTESPNENSRDDSNDADEDEFDIEQKILGPEGIQSDEEEDDESMDNQKPQLKTHGSIQASPLKRPLPTTRSHVAQSPPSWDPSSKTSVLRMETAEMLQRITPTYTEADPAVDLFLRKLKTVIENIPDCEPLVVEQAETRLRESHGVVVPFPHPRPSASTQYKFAFSKPSNINVTGSHALKTATNVDGKLSVDLVVEMPFSLFTEKDYLNYRYFHKRAFYLARICEAICDANEGDMDVKFDTLNGNYLQPTIVVRPKHKMNNIPRETLEYDVRILLSVADGVFPHSKTLPDKNCVRPHHNSETALGETLNPTPFYNASLRMDCSVTNYLKLLHGVSTQCAGFCDACRLGRLWLRQRGFDSTPQNGGLGAFEWMIIMALLLQGGREDGDPFLSPSYDCHQLFRATLQFFATRNLVKKPLFVGADRGLLLNVTDKPIVFDGTRSINPLFKMTPWSYKTLRHEAQLSIRLLSANIAAQFEPLFIIKVSEPLMKYDLVVEIPLGVSYNSITAGSDRIISLYETLKQGLGNRASLIGIKEPVSEPWSIESAPSSQNMDANLQVGLILDNNHAWRSVDRGPSAEDAKAAAAFREFWQDKAELRRFKDGAILESIVWSGRSPLAITREIVVFLIGKTIGAEAARKSVVYGQDFNSVSRDGAHSEQISTHLERSNTAYKALESKLRALDGVPLQIRQIQVLDPWFKQFSLMEDFKGFRDTARIHDTVIQFEGSSRWPDDLGAIQMTKIAFLLKLDDLLREDTEITVTRLGVENEHYDMLNKSFLDIIYKSGISFRVRIHHDREQVLLERLLADKTVERHIKGEAAFALSEYKRCFVKGIVHAQAMYKLSTQHARFTETVGLLKGWFNAHLLGTHFREEAIELIAAKTYIDSYPWPAPSSGLCGFFRALSFLSQWNWQSEPLIVDLSADMKHAEIAMVQTRFDAWRKVDPMLNRVALFMASDLDFDGATWTEHKPPKVVASRMTSLARAAHKVLMERGLRLKLTALFKTSLREYDFIIRLHKKQLRTSEQSNGDKILKVSRQRPDLRENSSNPVTFYLDELRELYGDAAVFFYNPERADMITGLWSPHTARRSWKVNLGYSTAPFKADLEDSAAEVSINKEAMLCEMAQLGKDMVVQVEMNQQ